MILMKKWLVQKLHTPLKMVYREGYGRISHNAAKKGAIDEYKEFNKHQKIVSDFDKVIKKIQGEQK